MIRRIAIVMLALGAAACQRTPAADPAQPSAYAVRLPFSPAAGAALQRVALPAAALVAMQRPDAGDLRVFDAKGRLVPFARIDSLLPNEFAVKQLTAYHVTQMPSAAGHGALSVRVEGDERVVTVDASGSPAANPAPQVLLDTRGLTEPAQSIALDMATPAGQPVAVSLMSSTDLKDWQPLGEKMLFRVANDAAPLGGAEVKLDGADLHGRYVGLSWGEAAGVVFHGAQVTTSAEARPARVAVAASGGALTDAHEMRFDLPGGARASALRLTEGAADGVIPVRLWARAQGQDPWTLVDAGTLRSARSVALDISAPTMTHFKLEADERTAGFTAAPRVQLLFDPVELVVAVSGTPPFTLAAGQAEAAPSSLSLAEIAPQGKLPPALPQMSFAAAPQPVIALQAGAADGAFDPRKGLLWAALLLGVGVLGFAAFRLARAPAPNSNG